MLLNTEVIDQTKKNIDISRYFEPGERVTAISELLLQFNSVRQPAEMPRLLFYILMIDCYGLPPLKVNGEYAYRLAVKQCKLHAV